MIVNTLHPLFMLFPLVIVSYWRDDVQKERPILKNNLILNEFNTNYICFWTVRIGNFLNSKMNNLPKITKLIIFKLIADWLIDWRIWLKHTFLMSVQLNHYFFQNTEICKQNSSFIKIDWHLSDFIYQFHIQITRRYYDFVQNGQFFGNCDPYLTRLW